MGQDIFGKQITHGGAINADRTVMTMTGVGTGQLVQSFGMNYSQAIGRFYDLTTNAIYLIGGRTQGSANMGRIVGPAALASAFYRRFGDICNAGDNSLDVALKGVGCRSNSSNAAYRCRYAVLALIGAQIDANSVILNENGQLNFSSLEYGD